MSAGRALLTRGRGAVLALGAAVVASLAAGWLRGLILPAAAPALVALPFSPLRRLALGLLLDAPLLLCLPLLAAAARLVIAARPLRAALAVVAFVVAIDVALSALVSDDTNLWTDGFVLAGRLPTLAAAVLATARAFGWRRKRAAPPPTGTEEPAEAGESAGGDATEGDGPGRDPRGGEDRGV